MRKLILFTNRNCIIFNEDGNQDVEAQSAISCYEVTDNAQQTIDSCEEFYIAKWQEWKHRVTKKEIEYLLGLRNQERDTKELKIENKR